MGEWLEDYYNLNIKPAFKNAMTNFKANICIFIVIYLLQALLGAVFIASDTNDRLYKDKVTAEYDYHIVFRGLSPNSAAFLTSGNRAFKRKCVGEYRVVADDESEMNGGVSHDVYIKLIADTKEYRDNLAIVYFDFMQQFRQMLLDANPGATVDISPLYYAESDYKFSSFTYYTGGKIASLIGIFRGAKMSGSITNIFGVQVKAIELPFMLIQAGQSLNRGTLFYGGCAVFALCCALFVLWNLFSVRTNELRHTLGIYVTFGADRKKLLALTRLEMLAVSMITLIPAYATAALLDAAVFGAAGSGVVFGLSSLFCVAVTVIFAVWVTLSAVVGAASRRCASELMASGDNSNYVSSPRVSSGIGKKLSFTYTLLHFRRFRRYYLQLIASAVTFSVLFCSGIYLRGVYIMMSALPSPQFSLSLNSSVDSDFFANYLKPELDSIPGIERTEAEMGMNASSLSSHMLVEKESAPGGGGFVETETEAATMNVKYVVLDSNALELLADFEYEGELSGGAGGVILSVPMNLRDSIALAPGDRVSVAELDGASAHISDAPALSAILWQQLSSNRYKYTEYTVSAVVYTDRIGDMFNLYIPEADYLRLTRTADAAMFSSFIVFSDVIRSENLNDIDYNVLNEDSVSTISRQGVRLPYVVELAVEEQLGATERVIYVMANDEVMAQLEGSFPNSDIDSLRRGDIVISCSSENGAYLNIQTGDPLLLAQLTGIRSALGDAGADVINAELFNYIYQFHEYTVGAVVNNGMDGIFVYLPEEDYYSILAMNPYYRSAEIYVDEGLTAQQISEIQNSLKGTLIALGGGSLVNHNTEFFRGMEALNNRMGWIVLLSGFMLVLGAPCLYYMQIMFYRKRRSEILVFRVFGACEGDIRALHLRDGGVLAIFTGVIFAAAGVLASLALHALVQMTSGRQFSLELPAAALIASAALLAVSAILSAFIPYLELRTGERTKTPPTKPRKQKKEAAE